MTERAAQSPAFQLRGFVATDFETLWRLDQICFTRGIAYSKAELAHFIKAPQGFTLVAEKDSAIVGFIVVERNNRLGRIVTIDVHPDQRRSGLGTLLMMAAEARLSEAGLMRVILEVAVDNIAAIHFYKRHGYSVVKTIPRYYLGSLDAFSMEKRINASTSS